MSQFKLVVHVLALAPCFAVARKTRSSSRSRRSCLFFSSYTRSHRPHCNQRGPCTCRRCRTVHTFEIGTRKLFFAVQVRVALVFFPFFWAELLIDYTTCILSHTHKQICALCSSPSWSAPLRLLTRPVSGGVAHLAVALVGDLA